MATYVNRTVYLADKAEAKECLVIAQDYTAATMTVLVFGEDARRIVPAAAINTTLRGAIDATNEWRRDNCTWCNGSGKLYSDEDGFPCPHCQPTF